MGWRRLLLLPIALLASLAVVLLARTLAQTPDLDARWRLDATGHLQMIATDLPWMRPALGRSLEVIVAPGIAPLYVDGRRVVNSTRWIASDEERDAATLQQRQMARVLQPGVPVVLGFTDRMSARVTPHARGYTTLFRSLRERAREHHHGERREQRDRQQQQPAPAHRANAALAHGARPGEVAVRRASSGTLTRAPACSRAPRLPRGWTR